MTKDQKGRILSVLVITAIIMAGTSFLAEQVHSTSEDVPPLIRLHVLANSDSELDQSVKLKVRDAVVRYLGTHCEAEDLSLSRSFLRHHLRQIEQVANEELSEIGQAYQAKVQFGVFNFPAKSYGSFVLPAGRYEAVTVVLGEGQGRNWWCVLFPRLCFTKENTVPTNVASHAADLSRAKEDTKFRFALLEWIKNLFS